MGSGHTYADTGERLHEIALEWENAELRRANEILKDALGFFRKRPEKVKTRRLLLAICEGSKLIAAMLKELRWISRDGSASMRVTTVLSAPGMPSCAGSKYWPASSDGGRVLWNSEIPAASCDTGCPIPTRDTFDAAVSTPAAIHSSAISGCLVRRSAKNNNRCGKFPANGITYPQRLPSGRPEYTGICPLWF